MTSGRCELALIQMRVQPGAAAANTSRAVGLVREACRQGAEMVLLPEVLDCGWTHPSARDLAGAIPGGDACEALRAVARDCGVYLCAGLAERCGRDLFNAAMLVAPDGTLALHHRKIHEIEFARRLYRAGDRLGVAETPWGRVGVMICADAFIPGQVISRTLGAMGARWVVSPCAWAVPGDHDPVQAPYGALWRDSYGGVAREFGMAVAGCSNVGPVVAGAWRGWRCIGCSLVMGSGGSPLLQGPYGIDAEQILRVTLGGARPSLRRPET